MNAAFDLLGEKGNDRQRERLMDGSSRPLPARIARLMASDATDFLGFDTGNV